MQSPDLRSPDLQSPDRNRILFLTRFSLLLALEALFCFTPLGSIPVGPIVATLAMVPVIITAIVLGTKAGAVMGFFAGLFSCIIWTFSPPNPLMAFIFTPFYSLGEIEGSFWSLVICFVPRILVGVVAGGVFQVMQKRKNLEIPGYIVGAVLGSMTNTILVLGGTYLFFGREYASVENTPYAGLLALIGLAVITNGIPEAIVSAVASNFVCIPVRKFLIRPTQ